jgi:hypothetical protein
VRSIAFVEIQQLDQVIVTTTLNVLIDENGSEIGATKVVEIHSQERYLSRYIRTPEARRELKAVEKLDAPPFDTDAAGMKVAVPLTDATFDYPPLEKLPIVKEECLDNVDDPCAHGRRQRAPDEPG